MTKKNASASLKESIRLLEIRQAEERNILKEHMQLTYQSLNPINLLKTGLKELGSSDDLKSGLFETLFSVMTGYLTQKMVVRSKGNTFKKIVIAMMQYGVTSFVTKNTENIRNFVMNLIDKYITPEPEEVVEPEL